MLIYRCYGKKLLCILCFIGLMPFAYSFALKILVHSIWFRELDIIMKFDSHVMLGLKVLCIKEITYG